MKMKKRLIIGTRGSRLALKQTEIVIGKLKKIYPDLEIETKIIKTRGDTVWDKPLHLVGGKGLFVKEIEEALIGKEIDIAVHSMKDLPTELEKGLSIGAILERDDPRDVFISKNYNSLKSLPQGALIGTSSLRRRSQLLRIKNDIEIVDLRGNIDTRIKKISEKGLDGVILAYAGVKRMGFEDNIREVLSLDEMVPASGQGAIGIEIRSQKDMIEFLKPLNHEKSLREITIERKLQSKIGGGCQVPLGINASITQNKMTLNIMLGRENGELLIRERYISDIHNADRIIEEFLEKNASLLREALS